MVLEFFKKTGLFFWEVVKVVVIALVIVAPIRYFVFQPFVVRGSSMEPNFHDSDYLVVDELTYRFRAPKRGEVIVFDFPKSPSQRFIKRLVGLPGEQVGIKDGRVEIINRLGEKIMLDESVYLPWSQNTFYNHNKDFIRLGQDEYFVLGDNRAYSFDSEEWGVLKRHFIIGKVWFRAWPPKAMAFIPTPSYSY